MTGPLLTAYYSAACQSRSFTLRKFARRGLDGADAVDIKPGSSVKGESKDRPWHIICNALASITESRELCSAAHDRRQSSASYTSGLKTPPNGRSGIGGAAVSSGVLGQGAVQQQQDSLQQDSQQQADPHQSPGSAGGNRVSDSECSNRGLVLGSAERVRLAGAPEGMLKALDGVQLGPPLHVSLRDPFLDHSWDEAQLSVRQSLDVVTTGFDCLNTMPTDIQ